MVALKTCKSERLYMLAEPFNICLRNHVFHGMVAYVAPVSKNAEII